MKHILIITGGALNLEFAHEYCETLSADKVFAVDKGLEYAHQLGFLPDYIIGDFDTVDNELLEAYKDRIEKEGLPVHIKSYPVKKDASDTELAVERAIGENPDKITILAATGSRLDHVLANLGLLLQVAEKAIECWIVDENNRVRLLMSGDECHIGKREQHGKYLSLIPLTPVVKGLTITGVMYPLTDRTIRQGSSFTISNKITEEQAVIKVADGTLLVIESRD
ncbi:MAG: thiamine diphosphokinase [Lachnospiraceae bacterium]|nr:thiamine diphosphokinase [Lachnospiraceae bacterium]